MPSMPYLRALHLLFPLPGMLSTPPHPPRPLSTGLLPPFSSAERLSSTIPHSIPFLFLTLLKFSF